MIKYINASNEWLKSNDFRPLTTEEQGIVLLHLEKVASDKASADDLVVVLCIETAAKIHEIHPDLKALTKEQLNERREAILLQQKVIDIYERERGK